jgi:hypothetical protein
MNKARIFISYAREDSKEARSLYQRLKDAGYDPWMDKIDLFAGLEWQSQIERAIRNADFFVLCLSNNSVKKRGFVQREIRAALDLWQEKLEDDIYLIPVMLESLDHREVPDEIRKIHWVELYEEEGWAQLIRALEYGVEQRKITSRRSPPAEVEEKRESRTGQAARDKPPAPIPPPAQPVRPAPPQPTPEQTALPPIVIAPPIADKSPPAHPPQPELRGPAPDDAPKVVKLGGVNKAPQPPKTRPAAAAPKPKPRKTWSIAQASGLTTAKLVGLGLALPAIALLAWLLWSFGGSADDKASSANPTTAVGSGTPSPPPSPTASAPVLPARAEAMRYSLELENSGGRRVSGLESLSAGQRFQFHFTPGASGYLYLIAPDETQALTAFVTKQRITGGADFRFPGGDNWINVGAGARFIVIFSPDLLKELSFLNEDPRRLTREEQRALRDFQTRFASTAPETKASGDSAVVTAQKQSREPLVFEISVSRK